MGQESYEDLKAELEDVRRKYVQSTIKYEAEKKNSSLLYEQLQKLYRENLDLRHQIIDMQLFLRNHGLEMPKKKEESKDDKR